MSITLRKILFDRAERYARRRGFQNDAERIAVVDGWLAGYKSARKRDERVSMLLDGPIDDSQFCAVCRCREHTATCPNRKR